MPKVSPIPFPLRGLSETFSFEDQIPGTTLLAENVRGIDPKTGRVRGAQRSGINKYAGQKVSGDNFVQDLRPLTFDNQRITYTVLTNLNSNISAEWEAVQNGSDKCLTIAVSSLGDVYAYAARDLIEVYNSHGKILQTIQIPLPTENHVLRDLDLDAAGNLYACSGAEDDEANRYEGEVYKYALNEDDELELLWTLDVGGECPDIAVVNDTLHVISNGVDTSKLKVYTALSASEPRLLWERSIPWPSIQLDVNDGGDVFVSSPPNSERGQVGGQSWCGTKTVDWTPNDVASAIRWSWHRPEDIGGRSDGDEVDVWLDQWGDRAMFGVTTGGKENPRYRIDALCGVPGVEFNGSNAAMSSTIGGGSESENSLSLVPGYHNCAWVVARLIRPRPSSGRATYEAQAGDINLRWSVNEDTAGNPGNETDENETRFYTNRLIAAAGRADLDDLSGAWDPDPNGSGNDGDVLIEVTVHVGDDQWGSNENEKGHYRINGEEVPSTDRPQFSRERNAGTTWIGWNGSRESDGFFDGFYIERVAFSTAFTNVPGTHDLLDIAEKLEGYLAHKYGTQAILPAAHTYKATAPVGSAGEPADASDPELDKLLETDGIVAKFAAGGGEIRWAETGSGVGHAVRVDGEGHVWTTGAEDATGDTPNSVMCRLIIDEGTTMSEDVADGAWTRALPDSQRARTRMDYDREGNIYIPSQNDAALYKIKLDGTLEANKQFGSPAQECLSVAMDSLTYGKDYGDDGIMEPEFCYLGTKADTKGTSEKTLRKIKLVDSEVDVGAPRQTELLAVANGDIKKILHDTGGTDVFSVTGGTGVLDSASRIVRSVAFEGKAFFIDGANDVYYDPVAGEVKVWESNTSGELPRFARLLEAWRDRMLRARTSGKPKHIYMCAIGDAFNWNNAPKVTRADQATFIIAPGTVNALIPATDDLLIVGMDDAIWRFTGDPMDNGRWDEITRGVGMPFGRPWCKDDQGTIYFASLNGVVYRLRPIPGAQPEPMTEGRIQEKLRIFSYDTHTFRLEWNQRDKAIHVFVVPIDTVTVTTDSDPSINITSPTNNSGFDIGSSITFTATASDSEDGDLSSTVLWASDIDGALNGGAASASFSTSAMSEGVHTVTASVTDSGGNTAQATVVVTVAADSSPVVNITSPNDGSVHGSLNTIPFEATAFDQTDGDISNTLDWTSSKIGEFQTNSDDFDASLPVGVHVVTAKTIDSGGNEGQASIVVTVQQGTDPPIIDPVIEPPVVGPIDPQTPETPAVMAAAANPQSHYAWERPLDAWWLDKFASADMDPTSVVVVDGDDPNDRRLLIGSSDGYVREWDADEKNDDGSAIVSRVVFGPMRPDSVTNERRFGGWQFALASGQDGAVARFYGSDRADTLGNQVGPDFTISPGRNPAIHEWVRGQSVWLEVINFTTDERWAFETLAAEIEDAGRVKV